MNIRINCVAVVLSLVTAGSAAFADDRLRLGDPADETAHRLTADHSTTAPHAALDQPQRTLLPLDPPTFEGGRVDFTMKIDPVQQNYFTIKLWGSDVSTDRLVLFIEGKQVGLHHLGDVDLLDCGDEDAPAFNNRFFFNTSPLPIGITRGKTELHCQIRCIGPIWGYGTTFEQYQKPMTQPTRGIYAVYTHTDGCFIPAADDVEGKAPVDVPVRTTPGAEVLELAVQRVNTEIHRETHAAEPLNEMQCEFLARAYLTRSTIAAKNPAVVKSVTAGIDAIYAQWRKDPTLAEHDNATPNPGWFEFGPAGEAVCLLAVPLHDVLDQPMADGAIRRDGWSRMLQAGRDFHLQHRRLYTNQSMIIDLNICWSNRAIAAIDPKNALPNDRVLHDLYQSIGLEPWLGSDTASGPARPMGDHYFELTDKGLTKELGFVGYYGEVLDWVTMLYDATRPTPDAEGDPRIKAQLVKIAKARSCFRFPALDANGNRAMRIETIVGWRDAHHPGGVAYVERPSWDGSSLYAAAATMDPTLVGYVQQMFDDNQFFASVAEQLKTPGLRTTAGLLGVADQYAALKAAPANPARLPMTGGQKDFVWADEQDGVVAIKHGDEILYASLYWRARNAVNFLARVHDIRPNYEKIAVVRDEIEFQPSGKTYTRPDWTDIQFARGGFKYPGGIHSAFAGEQLPIAALPADDKTKPGDEDPSAGRGEFYTLRYGDYLIGMNASPTKTFSLGTPSSGSAFNLVTNAKADAGKPIPVGPRSTVVLWIGK